VPARRARSDSPPTAPSVTPDAAATADRLHSASIHLLRALRREDSKSGLTAPRLSALSVLVFGGPLTIGALAAAEQVRPPTMTRLVAALEAQGLVARDPDPSDGRVVRVRATPKGERLLAAGRARRVEKLAAQVDALDDDDRALLGRAASLIERVVESFRRGP